MRLLSLAKLSAVACVATFAPVQLFACQCAGFYGKNAWERSQKREQASTVIFEGVLEHSELRWSRWNGESLENPSSLPEKMRLTFRVQRAYKGDLGHEAILTTGLGGGDCGARFSTGLTYLVFGAGSSPGGLGVSMCSPGGWIEGGDLASDLRYLRKQPPITSDLELGRPLKQRQQGDLDQDQKRYSAATGSICGTVVTEKTKDASGGVVSFLSIAGFSPVEHPTANVNADGTFCSDRLGPGEYYLFFGRTTDGQPTSAVFYPGVNTRAEATAVEIGAGQNQSRFIFKVPAKKAYAVRGLISTNDKSGLKAYHGIRVDLVNLDAPYSAWYHTEIHFNGVFPLPNVKYFTFGDVLPGQYTAYIYRIAPGWSSKKVDVSVTTHMKFVFLDLVHRK
ncbi:MAG: hypothetical protein LAO55_10100 [Acidobacteriia bacterium]|nr:hypothetical protein [Terriglobia bacterium]